MAELMVHRDVLTRFGKLPVKVQRKLPEFIDRFQQDPADSGLRLHPLKGTMKDSKVRGAELPGGYRAIIIAPETGDTYVLIHVDTHDEAYAWAENKHFEVHPNTGIFQIIDVEAVSAAKVETSAPAKAAKNSYVLDEFSDQELFDAGVPEQLLASVRAIRSDDELLALGQYLPPDCRDMLIALASGMTVDEALDEMLGAAGEANKAAAPAGRGDFRHISTTPHYDLVLLGVDLTFEEALRLKIEEWRVFLHPYQRKLVTWNVNGPMSITGAAGTGKTVVLMHRAVRLARELEKGRKQVLVTTFTTNLSTTLKHHIAEHLAPDTKDRIDVTNLHALARSICQKGGWKGRIATDKEMEDIWGRIWAAKELGDPPLSREEMVEEFLLVIDPNGIETVDQYFTTIRSGRPRISRTDRKEAWPFFVRVRRELKRAKLLTFDGALTEARFAVEKGNVEPYRHVLVDEGQDFSLEALRLVRALSGGDAANSLCIFGDGHQRIYRERVPLSRAGIQVRGRSRRLKINYRTSEEIRKYAQALLEGREIDDLDEGAISTRGDHSLYRGPLPERIPCRDNAEEANVIATWVKGLIDSPDLSMGLHEVCVACRSGIRPGIIGALRAIGLSVYELQPRQEDPGSREPGVRLGTIHRIKGLEFRAVAIACSDPDDALNNLDSAPLRKLSELYVAATRAREFLLVTMSRER